MAQSRRIRARAAPRPASLLARLLAPVGFQRSGRDPLGARAERLAARTLRRSRYRILGRNLRAPMGEADLLALDPDRRTIVLVEVKSRRTGAANISQPPPEAAITRDKRRTLVQILRYFARANGWSDRPLRIDVIAVEFPASATPVIRHHRAFVSAHR